MLISLWLPTSALVTVVMALTLVGLSYFFGRRQKWPVAVLAVTLAALLIRVYASADRALHPWDERYHALVAKNFIQTPLVPRLYHTPVLPYNYKEWTGNYIWMHKPPLTLWLQAASMEMLGVHEFALRLPSILFSTAAVSVTFAIGKILFTPAVGLLAAIFQSFNGFLVDLAAGRRVSDHVDTLLIFLFELGLFVALRTTRRGSVVTSTWLGIACGAAYLTKSFPALLMLAVWAGMRLQTASRPLVARELGIAALVTGVIAAPWAVYTALTFPVEATHERAESLRRITEVLEGHGGPPWWYVADMPRYFGELIYVPIAIAIWTVIRNRSSSGMRAILVWAAVPYAVFSACATKAPGYVMVAAPAVFLLQATAWLWLWRRRHVEVRSANRVLLTVVLILLAVLPSRQLLEPTGALENRERNPKWVRDLRGLNERIGAEKAVVFNIKNNIEAMFYTPYIVYPRFPSHAEVRTLQQYGYRVYVFDDGSSHTELPVGVSAIRPE